MRMKNREVLQSHNLRETVFGSGSSAEALAKPKSALKALIACASGAVRILSTFSPVIGEWLSPIHVLRVIWDMSPDGKLSPVLFIGEQRRNP